MDKIIKTNHLRIWILTEDIQQIEKCLFKKNLLNLSNNSGNVWWFSLGLPPSYTYPQFLDVEVLIGQGKL